MAIVSSLVVDIEQQGLGIGGRLLDFINYSPKLKYFKKILVQTASIKSKRIVDKRGFKTIAYAKYIDFVDQNGGKPFADIYERLEKLGLAKENDVYSFHILERN